LLPH